MNSQKTTNQCPVCGAETKEDEIQIYCEHCGFNVRKKEETSKPKES